MGRSVAVTMPARGSSRVVPAPTSVEARLSLAEVLIACDPGVECAERTLQWLNEQSGAQQAVCLTLDANQRRLSVLASHGVPTGTLDGFTVDVEDRAHPLVSVLFGRRPVTFDAKMDVGFGLVRSFAVALYGFDNREEIPAGVLLLAPVHSELVRDARWAADLLGHKLVRWHKVMSAADSERRLWLERVLLDAVPDPILLTDNEGRLLLANARAQVLFTAAEHESEGRRRAVALNNMLLSSALAQAAMHEGPAARRELLLVDPVDGSDLLFELLSTVTNDPREGSGIVSILRNVSDLRRATEEIEENYRKLRLAEAAARAERDRMDLIIDSVADPILVTDPAGAIVMMNAPAERLFVAAGGSDEQTRRISANDANFSSFISNLFFLGEGPRRQGGVSLVDPESGTSLPMEAVSGKILSEHGEVSAVVTILHDRTEEFEKLRLYEELKQASEQLEEKVREATGELVRQNELLERQRLEVERASAAKSQFLANMSHEFRTPLNAIMGYTSMLQQGVFGALESEQKTHLGRVDSNAKHLMAIINDILDISRIEAGRMPLRPVRFSPAQLITELLGEVEPLIQRSKLRVTAKIDPNLPVISSDRAKVKQILLNLLTNAFKFTPKGTVTVRAQRLRARRAVSVAVIDSGIGIAEQDQVKVFEDFQQADNSPAREYGGVGLGLSICRRLATMLDGDLAMKSAAGQGSTFTLVLPLRVGRR